MITKCERCRQNRECRYHGSPADPDKDEAQSGEWLCEPCVPLRSAELDQAIEQLERSLED